MITQPDGATPLEYDEIKGLIPTHITTKGELDTLELRNIARAFAWTQTIKTDDILTDNFICLLHKKMFGDVWRWAGVYRKTEKNIGILHIEIPMVVVQLCDDAKAWIENKTYPPDELAARFHHRLVFIHPFSNGNGRLSRIIADLILEKIFDKKPFSWGKDNLLKEEETRAKYLESLKAADEHDFTLLLNFVRS